MTNRYTPQPGADEDQPASSCGWFDSSLDLLRGLSIIEHEGDAVDATSTTAFIYPRQEVRQ